MMLWKRMQQLLITQILRLAAGVGIEINGTMWSWPITLDYVASLVTQPIFTARRACQVVSIIGRVQVAGTGGACTISFYKVPAGTAVGSGTLLHSGNFNLVGTVNANQTLTLSTTLSALQLAAGDSIGYVLTGTATSAVGVVTIDVQPN